jgi:hypothetical protein
MKYILTITLALFVSVNVSAEEMTEQDYLNQAKEMTTYVLTSKVYLENGKYGYHLYSQEARWIKGSFEAKSSELCGKKGYKRILDEKLGINRRQVIQCNE